MDLATQFQVWSDTKHIRKKDMYLGAKEVQPINEFVYNEQSNKIKIETIEYSVSLKTCFDEILVNAIDHFTRSRDTNDKVKEIRVTFNLENGEISVLNDGTGIPVELHPTEKVYIPELIATRTKAGSNLEKNETNAITGGTNGIGMTLTITCSICSSLETCDSKSTYKQNYRITESNNEPILIKEPPVIARKTASQKQYTKLTFLPDYKLLGYPNGFTAQVGEQFYKVIEFRLIQTAVFLNQSKTNIAKVYFNNKHLKFDMASFAALVVQDEPVIEAENNDDTPDVESTIVDNTSVADDISVAGDGSMMGDKPAFKKTKPFVIGVMTDEKSPYAWDVAILPSVSDNFNISIINGIHPKHGGSHINHIKSCIVKEFKPKLDKEFAKYGEIKANNITDNINIIMKGYVANPSWDSQMKDELQTKVSNFKNYNFTPKFYTDLYKMIKTNIEELFLSKLDKKEAADQKKNKNRHIEKYEPAEKAGIEPEKCRLFIPEGNSAASCVISGIRSKTSLLGSEYNGIFNIGGVSVNARREVKIKNLKGETIILKSNKFKNTERLNSLFYVLGLNIYEKYDFTEEGEAQFKKLNYHCIVLAVDQDLDGMGNIASGIMSTIHVFWPNLYARGFVRRFISPIVRAFPSNGKEKVKCYYSEKDYKAAEAAGLLKNHKITYYKGLAGHKDKEVVDMFKPHNFKRSIYTYCLDKESDRLFNIYFGHDSNERKKVLRVPVDYDNYDRDDYLSSKNIIIYTPPSSDELSAPKDEPPKGKGKGKGKNKTDEIVTGSSGVQKIYFTNNTENNNEILAKHLKTLKPCNESEVYAFSASRHLQIETKLYQLDNVERKILHNIDGLNPSRRKCLAGSRSKFRSSNAECKVFQLGGYITEHMHYHHGDMSLSQTLIGMAQTFIGSRTFPMLQGLGMFGTRQLGGKDAGNPRYISANLNKEFVNALYPPDDDYILNYKFEDGERAEPAYFVPVVPFAIMEDNCLPGHGWKIEVYGRDHKEVIYNVKALITNKEIKPMNMKTWNFNGKIFRNTDGKMLSVGNYTYNSDTKTVHITELPHGTWIETYKLKIREKPIVVKILDNCDLGNDKIDITIKLKEDIPLPKKIIPGLDHIIQYFEIYTYLNEQINFINPDGVVIEYKDYESVMMDWFVERKEFYKLRIDRDVLLTKYRILYYENVIRFCKNQEKYNLSKKANNEEADTLLEKEKYIKFNKSKLDNPEYMEIDQFEKVIIENGTYNYLHNLTTSELYYEVNAKKREEKLKELRDYLAIIEESIRNDSFTGASIWLKEVEKLEEIIEIGLTKGWSVANKETQPTF